MREGGREGERSERGKRKRGSLSVYRQTQRERESVLETPTERQRHTSRERARD